MHTGANNERVYARTERRNKNLSVTMDYESTPMERIKVLSKPMKLLLNEKKLN